MGQPRRIKDYIDINELYSLDILIDHLKEVQTNLPPGAQPEIRLRGDDVFGWKLSICYSRWQTQDEVELEEKYKKGQRSGRSKSNSTK